MSKEPDYYELLQVPVDAESTVIKASYRRLARRFHPDVAADPKATERMRALNRAIEVLADPLKRQEYDRIRLTARAREALAKATAESGRAPPGGTFIPPSFQPSASTGMPTTAVARREAFVVKPRSKRRPVVLVVGTSLIALAVLSGIAVWVASDPSDSAPQVIQRRTTAAEATPFTSPSTPSATPVAAVASASPASSLVSPFPYGSGIFESRGTWLVGAHMAPGIWRAYRAGQCSWKRMASLDASGGVVAGSGSSLTVELLPSDVAFWSEGCGWWTQVLTPPSASPTDPFGPGTWLIPAEIAPGKWQNSDSSGGCAWALLNTLDGGPSAVLDSGVTTSIATMEITARQAAFDSQGCGTWTRISD